MDNVFGIAELAESIFLECRIQDLLTKCQRVSKQWQDIITTSERLQQALFFRPLPGYRIGRFDNDEPHQPDSYFVDSMLIGWSYGDPLPADSKRRLAEDERTLVFANPFLDLIFRKSLKYFAPARYVSNAKADYEARRAKMSEVEPSWWRMLASQPPVNDVCFLEVEPTNNDSEIERYRNDGILILHTICREPGYRTTPQGFDAMVPVTFAKDVVRVNYKKGELKFEECELDLW